MSNTPRFAVFGHPVAQSQSPFIHGQFSKQTGISLNYSAIDVTPEALPAALEAFAAGGGRGVNITLPLKEAAMACCVDMSSRARLAGAVNTLTWSSSGWMGDNTDGSGFMRDISDRVREHIRGRRALLLGAGGAAHGVAPALADSGVEELIIVNRTPARADKLVDAIGDPAHVHTRYWEALGDIGSFDLIINATSAGRDDAGIKLPFSLAGQRCIAYDLNYGEAAGSFLAWAKAAGAAHLYDGLGMLVEQAADAFEIWHDVRPDTDAVYDALRERGHSLHTGD